MNNQKLVEKSLRYGAHNYHPLPIVLTRAEGAVVTDVEGKQYLDFLSCYSALNFGHQHPKIVKALKDQLDKIALCSRAFESEELCYFVEELAAFCGLDAVLPMNSGAEGVETAIKIARKWAFDKKRISNGKIIVMENNFHGRTITVISFSSEDLYRRGFGPLTPGFETVPFGDFSALEKVIDKNTIGVLLEPVQAEAGVLLPPKGYLSKVRKFCDQNGILLLLDEIQTGLGRTGRDFCFQYEDAKPDLLILGKSLGGGLLPVSAVIAKKQFMDVITPGTHGSTFGGNPLACAVARSVLKLMKEEKISQRAEELGAKILKQLQAKDFPQVKEIRGMGGLIGIELKGPARPYCEWLAKQGVLCKETHEKVIRIAPPLIIDEASLKKGISLVMDALSQKNLTH